MSSFHSPWIIVTVINYIDNNKLFFLLFSFQSSWIIVTVINYITNIKLIFLLFFFSQFLNYCDSH